VGVGSHVRARAGRGRVEAEGLLGLFINALVLRTNLAGDPDVRTLLRRVREVTLGAFAHQDLPFPRLLADVLPDCAHDHNLPFPAAFVLQNAPVPLRDLPGLAVRRVAVDSGAAVRDLLLMVLERGRSLEAVAKYRTDIFDRGTIARLLARYEEVLAMVADDPERRLSAFRQSERG